MPRIDDLRSKAKGWVAEDAVVKMATIPAGTRITKVLRKEGGDGAVIGLGWPWPVDKFDGETAKLVQPFDKQAFVHERARWRASSRL